MHHANAPEDSVYTDGEKNNRYNRPDPPAWLTRDLIQNCLARSVKYHDCSLVNFKVDYGCSPCHTFGSSLFRVSFTLREPHNYENFSSIIVKCIPADTKKDYLPGHIKSFKKEIMVLSKIMNEVNYLLKAIEPCDLITAEWIGAGELPTYYIMMEDLSAKSYQMTKKQDGHDQQHSLLVMRLIAKQHAATAVIIERNPTVVDDFKGCTRYVSGNDRGLRQIFSFITPIIMDCLTKRSIVPPRLIDEIQKLSESLPDALEKLTHYKPNRFNVLLQGDLWTNNLMFRYFNGEVMGVKFVDFQESFVSSPVYDLIYYVYSSLKEDVRINDFEFLIDEYYKTLCETLNMLEYGGHPYSMEDLRNDMKEYDQLHVFVTVFVTAVVVASEDNSAYFESTSRGHLEFFRNVYSNPVYISKLEKELLFLTKKGLL